MAQPQPDTRTESGRLSCFLSHFAILHSEYQVSHSVCIDSACTDCGSIEGGIPGVAADAEEYMLFLEQLVTEMKTVGYNPQLKWLTAQKPVLSDQGGHQASKQA